MSTKVDSLRNLYVEVAGEETLTEQQEEIGSREPIDASDDPADEVSRYARENGLEEALEGTEVES